MSLLDSLLNTDSTAAFEPQTKKFRSKRLQKILGESNPVEITLKEIPYRRFNDFLSRQFDKKGNFDFVNSMRAKALLAVEGVAEPNLKSEELKNHFQCGSAADLAEKLFGAELNEIADEISVLCGFSQSEEEAEKELDEIKNS